MGAIQKERPDPSLHPNSMCMSIIRTIPGLVGCGCKVGVTWAWYLASLGLSFPICEMGQPFHLLFYRDVGIQ